MTNAQLAVMMNNFTDTVKQYNAEKQEENQLANKVLKLRDVDK